MKIKPSDTMLYNIARAVTLALTGRELQNQDITDEQYQNAIAILRSLTDQQ